MKKHRFIIVLLIICLISPISALILYKIKYTGSGHTNKGFLLKTYIYEKKLTKDKWNIICNNNSIICKKQLNQIKKALGKDGLKVFVYDGIYNKTKFYALIGDPKGYIILGYSEKDWQENMFSDLKHLLKVN